MKTVAMRGDGIEDLIEALDRHEAWLASSGGLRARRVQRAAREVEALAVETLRARITDPAWGSSNVDDLAGAVVDGRLDPYAAADRLVAELTEL